MTEQARNVVHFNIEADDPERAKRFYEEVFGWRFRPWGPPEFWLIATGTDESPGIRGSLSRRWETVSGTGSTGFECTIEVEDLGAIEAAVQKHGGEIVEGQVEIPGVGRHIRFRDTEGNVAMAMRYGDPSS